MTIALAEVLQEVAVKTPDTTRYMVAAYLAIGALLLGYSLSLWTRWRKAEED